MEKRALLRTLLIALVLLAVVIAGYFLALYIFPTPHVAVIRLEGDIWGTYTAYLRTALQEAADDPAIRAVVLEIASPGGEVTASEDLYFEVLKLRESKPVVASINEIAASGAYYVASAADWIYAKPGSTVGNIGVISVLPDPDLVDEQLITTGPFKLSGGSQVEAIRQMEVLKETFLSAILAQRAERLRVDASTLSRGEVYLGLQAQHMGLVDQVGSQGDAVTAAAKMAKLRHYQVEDRSPELPEELSLFGVSLKRGTTAAVLSTAPRHLPPGYYYRYVETLP